MGKDPVNQCIEYAEFQNQIYQVLSKCKQDIWPAFFVCRVIDCSEFSELKNIP